MKIAWFTPYHAHSSIGDYSQAVVAEFRKEDEVVVFAPAADVAPAPRIDGGPVEIVGDGSQTDLLQRLKSYDLVVYNMGNHLCHKMIYEASIRHPGVVILHDLVMRDFFRRCHLSQRRSVDGLARHVVYSDGPKTAPLPWVLRQRERNESLNEAASVRFPMFKPALRRCLGVVVHSEYSRERVAETCPSPVVKLDLPPHGSCVSHFHEATSRPPHPSGKVELLSCGALNPNEWIHNIIEQIGQSAYLRDNVTYTILTEGENSYEQQLRALVQGNGLSHVVHLAGRTSDHHLWRQLTQADLVLNLRNPHLGESAGSLIKALFAGAAVLAWNHGCYAEFPDDVVHKISSKQELTSALEKLCGDRPRLVRMGANARRYALEHFDLAVFCRRFRDFAAVIRSAWPLLELTDLVSERLLEFGEGPPNEVVERLAGKLAALTGTDAEPSMLLGA